MIIKINREQTIQEANPNIDIEGLFPELSQLTDTEIKVIALFYDYESPYSRLSKEARYSAIADYLETDIEDVITAATMQTNACVDYCSKQQNTTREILIAVEEQALKISKSIRELEIKVGALASEEKSYDHYLAWVKEALDLDKTIVQLKERCQPDYLKELKENASVEKVEQATGNVLSNRFGKKK